MAQASVRDRFRGCLVGLAVGDALGYPAEFRSRKQILESFPPDGITDFERILAHAWPKKPWILARDHDAGTYSDDTQMSLAVAEALIESGSVSLDELMVSMGRRFVAWADSPDNDRFPGETCMRGCRRFQQGIHWKESGIAESKGAGSAMRAAPIGLRYFNDPPRLLEVARASSLITHGHPAALEGTAAVALLVRLAVEERDARTMYELVQEACRGRSEDFDRCWERLEKYWDAAPEVALTEGAIGEAWVGEEAAAAGLYCFARSRSFEEAVLMAVNTDGDSDTIGCVTGAIAGAFYGFAGIPRRFSSRVENAEGLIDLADRLWTSTQLP